MIKINRTTYLYENEASVFLGYCRTWIAVRRIRGLSIPPHKIMDGHRIYNKKDLKSWANNFRIANVDKKVITQ
jgi:hypothetical protein